MFDLVDSTQEYHFNPRSPCGERLRSKHGIWAGVDNFNPRSPCGERRGAPSSTYGTPDFNPRSPCGERLSDRSPLGPPWYFNPRSPCGERLRAIARYIFPLYFNPRSPCGERLFAMGSPPQNRSISIHAPRVGSDSDWDAQLCRTQEISIHAPRVGSDKSAAPVGAPATHFNPRSPCGERRNHVCRPWDSRNFNPRSPCGERQGIPQNFLVDRQISIHAPRVGSDVLIAILMPPRNIFQSTLPVWGATSSSRGQRYKGFYFNPRSPCGERLDSARANAEQTKISIHAPRVGSDCSRGARLRKRYNFNPRSPCGERPGPIPRHPSPSHFNPRSPCGERPEVSSVGRLGWIISIHAPRVGSDFPGGPTPA